VIHTGAPSYFYPPPPDGSDGWQCDAWYDLYTLAWFQRWEQWKKDLADLGFIKFYEQNFDDFPVRSIGVGGAWGDGRYNPDLRSAPGSWAMLGDGTDQRAVAIPEAARGKKGNGILLTGEEFYALHHSSPDRTDYAGCVDTTIANGKARFEFWIFRDTAQSGITANFSGKINHEKDVSLKIDPGTGRVSYASGAEWIATNHNIPVKQWRQLAMDVDVDKLIYSAYLGDGTVICENIKVAPPKERIVEEIGVHVPMKARAYRVFDVVRFTPVASKENRVFLDDVSVKWKPTLHFAAPGKNIVFKDDFERADSAVSSKDQPWKADVNGKADASGKADAFVIEHTTSFGAGVKCLSSSGGASVSAPLVRKLNASGIITLDVDVFLRSDKDFPYIIPDPTTRSTHTTSIILESDAGAIAGVDTSQNTYRLWDGTQFVDTGKPVTYDVWTHLQIAIDPKKNSCQLVVQPLGELPSVIGQASCGKLKSEVSFKLTIKPSATKGHLSCYDNVVITQD